MKKDKTCIKQYKKTFYEGNRFSFFIALSGTLILSVVTLALSWLLQQLIDLTSGNNTEFTLSELAVISFILIFAIIMSELLLYHSLPEFVSKGISQYKSFIFNHLVEKNISAFSKENTSTYISALTNDIQSIEQGYLRNIFTIIESLLTFCGAVVLMFWYSPKLTLISISLALLPVFASILAGDRIAIAEKNISNQNEIYTSTLKDSLEGFPVIKSFKAEAQMIRIFQSNLRKLVHAQCIKLKLQIMVEALTSVAGIFVQLGVFISGAYLATIDSGFTAGTVMVFVQLVYYILSPIQVLPKCFAERKAASALIEKIHVLLNSNTKQDSSKGSMRLQHCIRIDKLSFGYEEGKAALEDVSINFELRKKYAIVGASGSGKTTLLNLLASSYPDYEGSILFDDVELRSINTDSLYEIISMIQQNVFIFNASIHDNVTMFSDFPKSDVDEAIKKSGLSQLVEARGEQYLCGENGRNLSGGERQRISIARCLLKKSQVLLVDEATSALDTVTAYQIFNSILALEKMTCIVVTHSLDATILRQYDQIIVLKHGHVEEIGTFDELMNRKDYFYSLFTVAQ